MDIQHFDGVTQLKYEDHVTIYRSKFDALMHALYVALKIPRPRDAYGPRLTTWMAYDLNILSPGASRIRNGEAMPERWIIKFHLYTGLPLATIYKILDMKPRIESLGLTRQYELREIIHEPLVKLAYTAFPANVWREVSSAMDALIFHALFSYGQKFNDNDGQVWLPIRLNLGIAPASISRARSGEVPIQEVWLLRLHQMFDIPLRELYKVANIKPSMLVHPSFGFANEEQNDS